MYCPRCGSNMGSQARFCPGCGSKKKAFSPVKLLFTLCLISIVAFAGAIIYMFSESGKETPKETAIAPVKGTNQPPAETAKQTVALPKNLSKKEQKALTDIIAEAQMKVYTLFTDTGQGSGFLVNKQGDVVTNAHVVEGSHAVSVKDKNGNTHDGKIIGYSNTVDVAVIRVPDLAGQVPLSLEKSSKAKVGEEVIAFGSPLSLENTATLGHITGVDRSFYIGDFSYDGVYQTSAAIAPGSSGGPLVSKTTGKVLAINSAKQMGQDAIGFSIPVKSIHSLIQEWIQKPMTEAEVSALFYNENGDLFYQDFWEEEGYFDEEEAAPETDDNEYDEEYDVPEQPAGEGDTYEEDSPATEIYEEDMNAPDAGTDSWQPPADDGASSISDINGDGVIDVNDVNVDINGDGLFDENDLMAAGIPIETTSE